MTELPINEGQSILEREVRDYVAKNLTVALGESFELARIEHPVSFGRIDILAWDSRRSLVAIELKRGIATREAIGQLQSYMGH
jgi:RecB family endonuclease NucS